jgi:hypothetical protein
LSATTEVAVNPADPPEDFNAYEKWANDRNAPPSPVALEPEEEIGETSEAAAVVSPAETATDPETVEDPEAEKEETEIPGKGGFQKRISKLTKTIRDLEAKLAEKPEPEVEPEVATPQAAEKPADGKPIAPKLADFESYAEYEEAHIQFVEQLTDYKATQLEQTRKAAADQAVREAEWSKAAATYDDFNEVVGAEDVKISAAMEAVMKQSVEGVHLAYYLGKHPEESLKIATLTLANNDAEWKVALARAGRELGKIEATLEREATKKPALVKAPAPKTTPTVTAAPKPPARLSSTRSAPPPDIHNEDTAADYNAWEKAREAQLRKR